MHSSRRMHSLILALILATALIGFVAGQPGTAKWVAESIQAEFASTEPATSRP